MKALEWSQHYTSFCWRLRASNSVAGDGIWPKLELIQPYMIVLVTCNNEEDTYENGGVSVVTTFPHYKSMGIFPDPQWQLTPQSVARYGRI